MLELTDTNFEQSLQKGKFLLLFYTDWCALCPIISSKLEALEKEEYGKFTFAKIAFEDNAAAVTHFGAPLVPLVLAVLDGRVLYGTAGLLLVEGYRMMINELLYPFDEALLDEKIKRIDAAVDKLLWAQIPEEPV